MSQAARLAGRPVQERAGAGAGETCRAAIARSAGRGTGASGGRGFLWAGLMTPGLFFAGFLGTAPPAIIISLVSSV